METSESFVTTNDDRWNGEEAGGVTTALEIHALTCVNANKDDDHPMRSTIQQVR
jgi:hypothetical protein